MPIYKYKALSAAGEKIEGTYTGKVKEEVINMLRQNKYYPVSVEELIEGKKVSSLSIFNRVKTKDISVFCRQFYSILNAGVSIISCLDILKQQTENKRLKQVIGEVYESVQKGLTFSEAMKKHDDVFPELLLNMIVAGEASGNLDVIMQRMAVNYEKENKIQNKIKAAMVYPIVLSVLATGIVIFLLTFVMPTFVGMFEGSGVPLPLPTRIVLAISNAIKKYWYIVFGCLFGLIYLFRKMLTSDSNRIAIDSIKFRLPIIGSTTKKVVTSRFTRTLATLLSSGIPLIQALEIVARIVGNRLVEEGIMKAKEKVKKGLSLAEPIKEIGLFPPMVISMITIGEESGALDEILNDTANYYDDEVEAALQRMTALLEPLMIVVMALVVGSIVIAMILPMFDMINTIQF